jgi:asparagine synthase (glutamine-hydrolysing)
MCGILGEYAHAGRSAERGMLLRRLVNSLRHRGPDDGACWLDGAFFLGHRRLSIIDLSAQGRQPMATADGRLVVTFNGEIYNHLELRGELESLGCRFRTHSDTEVLLHGYRMWGAELPARLIGMFAFAIADRQREELFLARDRFGEKPLLYAEEPQGVIFASELGPLAALLGGGRELNADVLPEYLCLNYVPGDQTLMKGVRRLPPGTWRLYRAFGEARAETFWAPEASEGGETDLGRAVQTLERLLDDSARLALRSDVPVGIFLSGGVDSSLVARSAARSGRLAMAYCLSFQERTHDEYPQASQTARQLGIPITRVVLAPAALGEFFRIVEHADDPLADSSALAVWTLAREAARQSKVVLSGDGGDELFGGYLTYKATRWHDALVRPLPARLRRAASSLSRALPTGEGKVSASYKIMRFLRAADLPPATAHLTWNGAWLPSQAARFLTPPALKEQAVFCLDRLCERHRVPDRPALGDLQILDIAEYLANDILVKSDRMSMAHGLEVRAPLLEPRLAQFALSLPARLKSTPLGTSKRVMRELARRTYGVDVAGARKQGFSIPVHAWLRGPARELAHDLLSEGSLRRMPFLDSQQVRGALQEHMSGRRSYGFELWGMMVLGAWHRARLERAPTLPPEAEAVPCLELPQTALA